MSNNPTFVNDMNLFGNHIKQIPCIVGEGSPTESTYGAVGMLYMDSSSSNGEIWKCIKVNDTSYIWIKLVSEDGVENVNEHHACFLELSENEEDAQANSDAITEAIAKYKHVILKMGDYPVKVGIIIDSAKLDLNNSRLYDVDEKSTGSIIEMKGERPVVCNGEIEGSWHLPCGHPDYVWREDTQCIRVAGVNDALIYNMDLHNVWGAGLVTNHVYGEMIAVAHEYMEGIVAVNSGTSRCTFQTPSIDIPEGYAYVSACGNWGFNYIISVSPVKYIFYDANGSKISENSDTPRIRIPIPTGAKTVVIYTICPTEELIPYYLNFTNYRENITVENVLFHHCNQAGWNNPCGPSIIRDCGFLNIGKPYPEAVAVNMKGGWGIDIEDQQCPQFIMDNCWSKGCLYMLLFGGYNGTVSNCQGNPIGAYRGWNLMLSNCVISRLYTHGNGTRNIVTHSVYADTLGIDPKCLTQIHGDISTSQVVSALSRFDRFTVISNTRDHQGEIVSGRLIGSVSGTTTVGVALNNLHPMKGSALAINTPGNSDVLNAIGDSWGITSDAPWLPKGYAIRDSGFAITNDRRFTKDTGAESSGLFENCEFDLKYPYFSHKQAIRYEPDNPTILTFRECTINNDGVYIFNYKPKPGSIITFERCTVSDKEHIINPLYVDISDVTVRFLDYSSEEYTVLTDDGTGYDYNIIIRDGSLVPVCRASGIEITTPPTKNTYTVGETVDLAGMVVSVVRQDGTKEEISNYTAPVEMPTDGVVTVTYSEFGGTYSTTFMLTITEATTE